MASPFFVKNLIKGKAAETIVFEMFQEVPRFVVVPFGVETIIPDFLKIEKTEALQESLVRLRQRPDFSIIDTVHGAHYLTEVKYRDNPTPNLIFTLAQELHAVWPTAYLCLVTPLGFFFDPCERIIAEGGDIGLMDETIIPGDIQEKYKKIILDTIRQKDE